MHNRILKKKYQIFTPEKTVREMLLLLKRRAALYGKSFLENSCGDGRFILGYVSMYVGTCRKQGLSWDEISKGLSRDVVGYELDKHKLNACKKALDGLMKKLGCPCKVAWSLVHEDFLRAKIDRKFDFIVGNPPYLSYWDVPVDDRKFIQKNFRLCKNGLWDYCFAFIEKSLSLLNDNEGQFCYIIPSSIFKTKAARGIRGALIEHLSYVGEYSSGQIFDGVLTSAAIVLFDVSDVSYFVKYRNYVSRASESEVSISRQDLKDSISWRFAAKRGVVGRRRFGDYFRVSSSVATLCNAAFVLKGWYEVGRDFIEDAMSGERIEKAAVKCAARPRGCRDGHEQYIIFPYSYNDETKHWEVWPEAEFKRMYPNAFLHLSRYKKQLQKRDADKNAVWYGYGRSQALSSLQGDKLLISQVVTNGVNVHWLHDAVLPYSGYYIRPKGKMALSTAARVLASRAFAKYSKSVGVGVNGSSMRLTTTNILDFTW